MPTTPCLQNGFLKASSSSPDKKGMRLIVWLRNTRFHRTGIFSMTRLSSYRVLRQEGLSTSSPQNRGVVSGINRTLVLLTNHLKFGATTVAAIYKDRWQIEIFFKAIKQNLKIKTFVGTSKNALLIQIWTALTVILLLKCLKFQ